MKHICVYAASSNTLAPIYFETTRDLGTRLAQRGHTLVYGAGSVGLMGVLGTAVHEHGGRVIGVIPQKLHAVELAYEGADELIITTTMRERKAAMESRADGFIVLPGGIGTLEEAMEVLVLKQLQYHHKPIVFINVNGIFDKLFAFFDTMIKEGFVKPAQRNLHALVQTPKEALDYIDAYAAPAPDPNWFDVGQGKSL